MRPFAFGRARRSEAVTLPLALAYATALAPAIGVAVTLPLVMVIATALAPTASSSSGGVLQPGVRYWGACGHRDQGGIYTSRSITNQCNDLKGLFNNASVIIYRAFGDSQAHADINTDAIAFQAQGIEPLVTVCTYPDWAGYANEAAAYADCYAETAAVIAAAPTVRLFEPGNEWNLQVSGAPGGNDGEDESDWTGLAFYAKFRGAAAGAIQAIRDNAPDAQVMFGPTSGWVKTGFVPALLDDLYTIYGLETDFAVNHWYRGEFINDFNYPDNVAGTGGNSYATMRPGTAPAKPQFHTEFGASAGGGSTDSEAATRITDLMDNYYAQGVSGSGSELGVIGGCAYELYPHGVFSTEYYLLNTDGTYKTQGTAVAAWIVANP